MQLTTLEITLGSSVLGMMGIIIGLITGRKNLVDMNACKELRENCQALNEIVAKTASDRYNDLTKRLDRIEAKLDALRNGQPTVL